MRTGTEIRNRVIKTELYECKVCGVGFTKWKYESYCSYKCVHSTRKLKSFVCVKCGKEFQSTYKTANCKNCKPKSLNITFECANCNETNTAKAYRFTKSKNKFCNKECFNEYHSKNTKLFSCSNCNKEIIATAKKQNQLNHFCSAKCKYEWNRGKNNYGWVGGSDTYRGENWNENRNKIVKNFDKKCVISGERTKLDVHHIIPYRISKSNDLSNLIPLKRNVHKQLELFQKELAGLLSKKTNNVYASWKLVFIFIYNTIVLGKIDKGMFMANLSAKRKYLVLWAFNVLQKSFDFKGIWESK